ncbi:MAG: S8 family serine peptidase [Anaerolineales bacterium]|nr:S8 family serine peptidase [Anaerolineales bacterium]
MNETPASRSRLATVIFLLFAPTLTCKLLGYHAVLWFVEQIALATGSLKALSQAGLGGLAVQAVSLSLLTGLLWFFSRDERYRPVYAGWFGAALFAFPALGLRLLGPNNDQAGALAQTLLALLGAGVALFLRRGQIAWNPAALPAGLLIAAIGIAPLAVYGAPGAPADIFLQLLAGLAFGLFAAALTSTSTENGFLDGLGIGALLAMLASAFGYDGGQLILLGLLPPFAFALSALASSVAAQAVVTGLLTAAGLMFFDPTELTILLGDLGIVALQAVGLAIGLGWLAGGLAWGARKLLSGQDWTQIAIRLGAGFAWTALFVLYFLTGHHGFYGDRLFVLLKDQADISDVAAIPNRNERLKAAYSRLTAHASASQADLRQTLDALGIRYTPYYLVNALEVDGGLLVRLYLTSRPEVDRVIPSPRLRPVPPPETTYGEATTIWEAPGWNIKMIGADKAWEEFGARGQGIVIGQSDSGVDGGHPALAAQYRGAQQGDDYNWFDPWEGTRSPNDEGGHGTHTLGTVLGKDGIGVAPEATWFACVNLNRNLGNPALYLDCMQFMLAPFPQGGNPFTDGDPTRAAHVLNNSWGCPEIEGCDPESLRVAAEHLRHAGIFVVVSAGNDGPSCSTITAPLSLYDAVFSVGAVDRDGNIAEFSSRGPVTVDGSGRMKPDLVAPGVDIFSAMPGGTYAPNSGTSMAGPHVAGVVALMWSANPNLIGDIERTEQILIETATPYSGQFEMGCFEGGIPNAAYGYGIVNAYEAVKRAVEMRDQ